VYAWRDGHVIKVFHDWFSLERIEHEAIIGRAVHAAGLPAPLPGEILRVGGHNALVYERVDGPSMVREMLRRPWRVAHYASRLAALQAQLHSSLVNASFPPQKGAMEHAIRRASALSASLQSAVLSALASMPAGDRVCHSDLHPGNVLVTAHRDVLIDWENVALGNPVADAARSSIILLGDAVSQPMHAPLSRLFHAVYLREYFRLRPGGEQEYRRWLPIVAAARLSENIRELEKWLLAQAARVV
jgi:aminoglycoside phosphotransferase (APT) family kinase protein